MSVSWPSVNVSLGSQKTGCCEKMSSCEWCEEKVKHYSAGRNGIAASQPSHLPPHVALLPRRVREVLQQQEDTVHVASPCLHFPKQHWVSHLTIYPLRLTFAANPAVYSNSIVAGGLLLTS